MNQIMEFQFELMEKLDYALIFLDEKLKFLELNRIAERELENQLHLSIIEAELCARNSNDQALLTQGLTAALSAQKSQVIFLGTPKLSSPIRVEIYPIQCKRLRPPIRQAALVVVLRSADSNSVFLGDHFRVFYGLTASEVLLCQSVFRGAQLNDHARDNQIKVSTVRWYLKKVFAKTGASSQRELRALTRIFAR